MKISNNKFTPESVSLFNDTWIGKKEWTKLEEKIPSMMNYNSVNEDGELNTSNKQDIQKSGKILSPEMIKQYQSGFVKHIRSYVDPNFTDTTTMSFDDIYGSVSGSVE